VNRYTLLSASRADFDLLFTLAEKLADLPKTEVSVIALARPSEIVGLSYRGAYTTITPLEIELPEPPTSMEEVFSLHRDLFGEIGQALRASESNLLFLLGDRSETLVAALCASLLGIPIAHLHGGELTKGAVDDNFRHAITKLSHVHFVASSKYEARVRQLGEKHVHNVGGIGLENARNLAAIGRQELSSELGIRFGSENYLLTVHPETISREPTATTVAELVEVLLESRGATVIATAANSDIGGNGINDVLKDFSKKEPRFFFFENLGAARFLSLARLATAVVGNSSSGLLEVPALGTPTINLGVRQEGRFEPPTVLSIAFDSGELRRALSIVSSQEFSEACQEYQGQLRDDSPSGKIAAITHSLSLSGLQPKTFVNYVP